MDLTSPVSTLPLVGDVYVNRLEKLNIYTIEDLLLHIPRRFIDFRNIFEFSAINPGETVTIQGEVLTARNAYTKTNKKIQTLVVTNGTRDLEAVWFNQPYLIRQFIPGDKVSLSGKYDWFGRKLALISPEYEKITEDGKTVHTGRLVPVYPETRGISSKWLRSRIVRLIAQELLPEEYLPEDFLSKYKLIKRPEAIKGIHQPETPEHAEIAKRRIAFDELLLLQVAGSLRKAAREAKKPTFAFTINYKDVGKFIDSLDFKLTKSQETAVVEILRDLERDVPMNRLLQGDVGSGKTVVGAVAALASFMNGYQSIFMAPTQILAQQHFETLQKLFKHLKIRITLVTSAGISGDLGSSDIFVGTHALIYTKLDLSRSPLIVIDEQHRFGVKQRERLSEIAAGKERTPHVLTMTATPIPRTIALTMYGDLDVSVLTEQPKGRKPITTWIVPGKKREKAYGWINEKITKEGIQAFVICPLIDESEAESMLEVKAVKKEFENIKKLIPDKKIGLLHGRLKNKEKDLILSQFREGKIDILVSTPVVEVGIDVPNATIIVIEAAERFGLAQLHQLRGRVGRGDKKSYCLLFTEKESLKTKQRLEALTKTLSGFELAELDLSIRGPGEVFGTAQSGFPELRVASWTDIELIQETKDSAQEIYKHPQKHKETIKYFKEKIIIEN